MMKSKVRSGLSRSRVPANSKLPSGLGLGEVLAAPGAADLHPVKWEPHLYNCTIEASSVKWEWRKFLPFEAMRVEYAVKVKPLAPYLSPSSREQKLVLIFRFFFSPLSCLWVLPLWEGRGWEVSERANGTALPPAGNKKERRLQMPLGVWCLPENSKAIAAGGRNR